MTVNLHDPDLGDSIAGMLLGFCRDDSRRGSGLLLEFENRLRTALVAAAHRHGPDMNSGAVLCDLLGPPALAHGLLAGDHRLMSEQLLGVRRPLRGQRPGRPRWKTPPLEAFEMEIPDVSPTAPFVVAPLRPLGAGAYAKWFLYERTMTAAGVTREGVKAALRMFGHHGQTFRVLLDGRVQRVRCLPPPILFITLQLFAEHAAAEHPSWVRPERRASLTRASQRFHDAILGRLFTVIDRSPSGTEASDG